jgi:hypothetical protein
MPYGQKPQHRGGERQWKKFMERFPPSLRSNYLRIHQVITVYGKGQIEWYHLKQGETRYRTKDRPGRRGKIFAWLRIYNGWLCAFIPQPDRSFRRQNAGLLKQVLSNYEPNYWYGRPQIEIALDVADQNFESQMSTALELVEAALTTAWSRPNQATPAEQ